MRPTPTAAIQATKALGEGIACDPAGCIGKLADGRLVSYVLAPDAFEEDCRRAAVIVATRDAPPDCDATVIGRKHWRERGALALYRDGAGFVIEVGAAAQFRPALGAARWCTRAPSAAKAGTRPPMRPHDAAPPRDATPSSEDLQADD